MGFIQRNKGYVVTVGIEFTIIALSFLVYRVANENLSSFGFSEYSLSRRTISLLQPLFMIGLGVAIPRYTSVYPQRSSILSTGILLLAGATVLFSFFLLIGRSFFADLFFGDTGYSPYIFPLLLMLFGYCLHSALYGFLRGKHNVYFANGLQLLNIGIIPVLVILFTSDVLHLLYYTGVILIFVCMLTTVAVIGQYRSNFTKQKFLVDGRTLLRYGLPRVLGDFALLALITAPTYLVLYFQEDMLISGDVAYSITLLNIVGAAFGPLGLVILPEVAGFLNKKSYSLIKRRFNLFIVVSLLATIVGYSIYFLFSDFILSILLGAEYRSNIRQVSLIILAGSFGYGLYIVLRSFLDAIKVRATNSINLIITLALYALLVFYNYLQDADTEAFLTSFAICMNFLGLITLIQTYRAIRELHE